MQIIELPFEIQYEEIGSKIIGTEILLVFKSKRWHGFGKKSEIVPVLGIKPHIEFATYKSTKFAVSDSEGFVCDFKIILVPL